MRRIAKATDGEHGAIAVIVAMLMVVLLGFAAISIDVAKLYSERAQLQNGADAAALMVAQKCAKDQTDTNCSATSPMASDLANSNAVDGLSNIRSIALNKSGGTVQVTAGAKETGTSTNNVSMFFAGVLGFPTAEVSAKSSAVWGSPKAGRTTFPLAFSICQVKDHVGGALQLLQDHGKNGNADCNYGPSGAVAPGGFGWLKSDTGACGATVDLAVNKGGSDTGANEPTHCAGELNRWASEINAGREITAYLPVFDEVTGQGSGAVYHLVSFAAFRVTGWKLSGDSILPYTFRNRASAATGVTSATECRGACRGIIGRFVKFVSLAEDFTLGPVDSNGALIVRLTP